MVVSNVWIVPFVPKWSLTSGAGWRRVSAHQEPELKQPSRHRHRGLGEGALSSSSKPRSAHAWSTASWGERLPSRCCRTCAVATSSPPRKPDYNSASLTLIRIDVSDALGGDSRPC